MIWWAWVALGVVISVAGAALIVWSVERDSLKQAAWGLSLGAVAVLLGAGVGTLPIGFPDSTQAPDAFRNTEVCS